MYILVEEVLEGCKSGALTEAFGTGTAATIAQITTIGYEGQDYNLPQVDDNSISSVLLNNLNDIRIGKMTDKYGWMKGIS